MFPSLVVLAFLSGLFAPWWWTILPWPVGALIAGSVSVSNEPDRYDMHGFGYEVGAGFAVLTLVVWLLGRGLRIAFNAAYARTSA